MSIYPLKSALSVQILSHFRLKTKSQDEFIQKKASNTFVDAKFLS